MREHLLVLRIGRKKANARVYPLRGGGDNVGELLEKGLERRASPKIYMA
jgi:hypothetical protein